MNDHARASVERGQRYQQQGQRAEAVHAYQTAVFYGIKDANLLERIGDLLGELGQWPDAATSYRNALTMGADAADLNYKLGNALTCQGKHSEAVRAYQRAIAQRPGFTEATLRMGGALVADGRLEDAIACYTQVTRQAPNRREAYQSLAAIFTVQGNHAGLAFCHRRLGTAALPKALSSYEGYKENTNPLIRSDDLSEGNKVSRQAEARSQKLLELGQYYQAVEKHPNSAEAYVHLADALFEANALGGAIAFYKIAHKLSPDDFRIALQLQRSAEKFYRYSREHILETASTLSPGSETVVLGKGNDYTFITQQVQQFVHARQPYHLPVSIIIPTYNRKDKLAKALAALTHQRYPRHLIDVIVADDGSSDGIETVIQKYQQHLTLSHVRQPDLGFRLAKVCNLGIAKAKHDHIILLQCDMIPRPELVEAYMQYLHVSDEAFLIGGRQFVCSDEITDDQILNNVEIALALPEIETRNEMWKGRKSWQDWRVSVYEKTNNLKTERYPYRAVVGSNLAFSKKMVAEIGGFSEDFHAWGGEDREFGYRAYNAGYYFIPVKAAQCLHQEPPGGVNESDRKQGQKLAEAGCEEKCPLPLDRKYQPGRMYEVPKVSICILAHQTVGGLKDSIESVLAQTYTDLEVCVLTTGDERVSRLEKIYSANPRVRWMKLSHCSTGEATDAATRMAKGAYVGHLRLSDVLKPNAVETWVDYLDSHDDSSRQIAIEGRRSFQLFRKRDWMRNRRSVQTSNQGQYQSKHEAQSYRWKESSLARSSLSLTDKLRKQSDTAATAFPSQRF
ncbi:MAG: glycosyltransferase [Phormidesmis sp.]